MFKSNIHIGRITQGAVVDDGLGVRAGRIDVNGAMAEGVEVHDRTA